VQQQCCVEWWCNGVCTAACGHNGLCIGGLLMSCWCAADSAVDNVILRDPPVQGVPLLAGLNLVPGAPQQPCPGEQAELHPAVTV
jgi:hypothetical protein